MTTNFDQLSDEQVIKLYFESRDGAAIGYLYKKYLPVVYSIALKYCRNQQNAEDVAMKVFEKLLSMSGRSIVNFKSWLCMVARNMSLEFLNKENRKQEKKNIFEESTSNFMENRDEIHLINEDKVETEKLMESLEKELTHLKEEHKVSLELFYFQNMSYQRIAEELKIDVKQVKSNIQNGKRKLKILMEKKNRRNE